jgi:hypothetical protein
VENSSAVLLLNLEIEKYERCVTAVLEYIVDKNPTKDNLLLAKEQRILYTQFRDRLIDMRDALK